MNILFTSDIAKINASDYDLILESAQDGGRPGAGIYVHLAAGPSDGGQPFRIEQHQEYTSKLLP